jgi:FlaA1/EpsC-like NDP-sugar epimerase
MSPRRARWAPGLPRLAVVLHDLAMVWLCWHGLYALRYSLLGSMAGSPWWTVEDAIVLSVQGLVLWRVGLYRGLWRFASVPDLRNLVVASSMGAVGVVIGLFLYNRLETVPRTVLLLYPFGLIGLLGTPRLLYRAWKESSRDLDRLATRVLILGAGQAGEALVRDLHRVGTHQAVGFLPGRCRAPARQQGAWRARPRHHRRSR